MKLRALTAKVLLVLVAAFLVLGSTSCNTLRGAGEDVEQAGEAVQDAAT
ncbi:MAG: entericidin A/B family lipoprotein [bacterium]|jgi:predicted small secreted protein